MKSQFFKIRIDDSYLAQDQKKLDEFLAEHRIDKVDTAFVQDKELYWTVLLFYSTKEYALKEKKTEKYVAADDENLSEDELKTLEALKQWRKEKATQENLPPYFIASNKELVSLAKFRPIKKEELIEIKGFGRHKVENYGLEIIEVLENV